MKKKVNTSMQTLVGIITPYAWDESDQVLEVSLCATDDEEYVIENGERFLDLVQKPIRAMGMVRVGKKIHRAINIKKFEMLDSASFDA
jgi:dUTPase